MTTKYPIQSPEHALLAGFVWGLAVQHGLMPEVDDDGNYTASVVLALPDPYAGITVRLIVEPPAEASIAGPATTATASAGPDQLPSITCPRCGRTSYNRNDIRERYCGFCCEYLDQME